MATHAFQCSSASRKFLKADIVHATIRLAAVSVLFSEPKIPQIDDLNGHIARALKFQCSSASRKFLKFGVMFEPLKAETFQCSSASRKFLKICQVVRGTRVDRFQCSSASRKFLKVAVAVLGDDNPPVFQCSSASRKFLKSLLVPYARAEPTRVSVLFSEPKIPQRRYGFCREHYR